MAAKNANIQDFFKPRSSQQVSNKSLGKTQDSGSISESPTLPSTKLVVKSSDDEDSGSDSDSSSFDELAALLAFQSSTHGKPHSSTRAPVTPKRSRGRLKTPLSSPLTLMPKYQFNMTMLVRQAEEHNETDASALRVQAMLDNSTALQNSAENCPKKAQVVLLESLVAEGEGRVDKVLRAVNRAEATRSDKSWYFFGEHNKKLQEQEHTFPSARSDEGWQRLLVDQTQREQILLSGFAVDMITMGDFLSDDIFLWTMSAICMETRDDLRRAYCDILLSAPLQIRRFVTAEAFSKMLVSLGGTNLAVDTNQKLKLVATSPHSYQGRDWTALRVVVGFMGSAAEHVSGAVCADVICLLIRLCADTVVLTNVGLLVSVQETIFQYHRRIEEGAWELYCGRICESTFMAVDSALIRLQILHCLSPISPRIHELRRRLALASFFEDSELLLTASYVSFDIREVIKRLDSSRFKFDQDTDYSELAALMSMLDMAIDNGLSNEIDLTGKAAEEGFNAEIDTLAVRIKSIWSNVRVAGASFISHIDSKEVMDGMLHRLTYTVRTRPKAKQSVFDSVKNDCERVRKQAKFMDGHFKKPKKIHERSVTVRDTVTPVF